MTCKGFEMLAATIAEIENKTQRAKVAALVGKACAATNSRFRFSLWYAACNVAYKEYDSSGNVVLA